MSTQELLATINNLTTAERLFLLEQVARSLREDFQPRTHPSGSLAKLRGIAKPEGEPPTDEEIREDYTRYLTEKYT